MALKLEKLPSTHKGVIQKFSELYVKTNLVEREIGKNLARGLRFRNLARYEKTIKIGKEEAAELLKLANDLKIILKKQLEE